MAPFVRAVCRAAVTAFAVASAAGCASATVARPLPVAVCDMRTTGRIVAIGDVHGAYDRFVGLLQAAGLVDADARWVGGGAILVQTGDLVDRGPRSREVLDLMRRLEREAADAGGHVEVLLGNHETMRMFGDWRDVSPEEFEAFRTLDSLDVREEALKAVLAEQVQRAREEARPFDEIAYRDQFMRDVPLGFIEMRHAFGPEGEYGRWLRERNTLVKVNDVVFVHGGLDLATASLGCERVNEAVRQELAVTSPTPTPEQMETMLSMGPNGPLWYRGLADEPENAFAPEVESILRAVQARAIVVGHGVVADGFTVKTRFGGRVVQIDTGMLGGTTFLGGAARALEVQGDSLVVISESGREPLAPLPPLPAVVPDPVAD